MPETSLNTRVEDINQHCKKVRSLLKEDPQTLAEIQAHLELTKPQTLTVIQRLEEQQEVSCRCGLWQLTQEAE
jgi:predicted transcriptional regulator